MIKLLSLFSGIGAFEKALFNLDIPFEVVNYCEIDKYASKSYSLIHNISETKNLGDITKVKADELPDFNLMTWGFPCTDISVAGKQAGIIQGVTRSGLYYEGLRILKAKKPKYSLIENVKNLTGKKFRDNFDQILLDLNEAGYNTYWKVLNAKDFGIPQNRERVFLISIRKDIDDETFTFSEGFPLTLKLKDLLDDEVDEKYYLNEKIASRFKFKPQGQNIVGTTAPEQRTIGQRDLVYNPDKTMGTLVASDYKQPKQIMVEGNLEGKFEQTNRVYNTEGISPTLTADISHQPNVISYVEKKYDEFVQEKGYVPELFNPYNKAEIKEVAPTQTTKCGSSTNTSSVLVNRDFRIRKLTPLECLRLMGFDDNDYRLLKENGLSATQTYKQAGNSICVPVLEAIFKKLLL